MIKGLLPITLRRCGWSLIFNDIYLREGRKERKVKGTHWCDVTVESVEDVEVPAGLFTDCIKLSTIFMWKIENGNHGIDTITTWLAPGVGRVKTLTASEETGSSTGKRNSEHMSSQLASAIIGGNAIEKK